MHFVGIDWTNLNEITVGEERSGGTVAERPGLIASGSGDRLYLLTPQDGDRKGEGGR